MFYKRYKNTLVFKRKDRKAPWSRVNSYYEKMCAFQRIYLHLPEIQHQKIQIKPYLYVKNKVSLGGGI